MSFLERINAWGEQHPAKLKKIGGVLLAIALIGIQVYRHNVAEEKKIEQAAGIERLQKLQESFQTNAVLAVSSVSKVYAMTHDERVEFARSWALALAYIATVEGGNLPHEIELYVNSFNNDLVELQKTISAADYEIFITTLQQEQERTVNSLAEQSMETGLAAVRYMSNFEWGDYAGNTGLKSFNPWNDYL